MEIEIIFTREVTYSLTTTVGQVAKATGRTVEELETAIEDGDFEAFAEYAADHEADVMDEGDPDVQDVNEA